MIGWLLMEVGLKATAAWGGETVSETWLWISYKGEQEMVYEKEGRNKSADKKESFPFSAWTEYLVFLSFRNCFTTTTMQLFVPLLTGHQMKQTLAAVPFK